MFHELSFNQNHHPLRCNDDSAVILQNKFRLKQIHQYKKGYGLSHQNKIVNEKCWINKKKEARFFCMRHFITSQIIHQIINCRKQHLPLQD